MAMTEAKAKTKWCPMVRVGVMPGAGGPAGINDPETNFSGKCIGSECALWQWQEPVQRHVHMADAADRTAQTDPGRRPGTPASWTFIPYDPDDGEPAQWVEPENEAQLRTAGYCGLVATPGSRA